LGKEPGKRATMSPTIERICEGSEEPKINGYYSKAVKEPDLGRCQI
jgi:hypothetical protein